MKTILELKNIAQIFENKYFIIPSYQRGYAWDNKQLKDFWEDLDETKLNQIHYTGSITLKPLDNKKFEIIDGQQRITTTIILLQCIINVLSKNNSNDEFKNQLLQKYIYDEKNKEYRFKYHTDNPSDKYFRYEILKRDKHEDEPKKSFYTAKLKKANEFFVEKLVNKYDEEIKEIAKKLISCFIVNEHILNDNFDVNSTFEAMNNRGKPLSTLELLKNRFLFLLNYFNLEDVDKKYFSNKINESYNSIYQSLGKNENHLLNDDDFLHIHWLSYPDFKYNRSESKVFTNDLLRERFTKKSINENKINSNQIIKYIEDLSISSQKYYKLHNPEDSFSTTKATFQDEQLLLYLNRLNRLGFYEFKPMVMNILKIYDNPTNNNDKDDVIELLRVIEKFIFITFGLCGYSSSYRNKQLYELAKDLQNKTKTLKDIIDFLNNIHILLKPFSNQENTEATYKDGKLNLLIFKQYNKIRGNFYKWRHINYLLYEYEYDLCKLKTFPLPSKQNTKKTWIQIEHIAPKTINPYWKTSFKLINKENEINYYKNINLLGNLLLLNKSDNPKLGNKDFDIKKEVYKEDSASSKEIAYNIDTWNLDEIIKRGERILYFANIRWELNISQDDIKSIANGEFFKF
jgi:uncharacterized protein with ParB-like and HNH nuclease domain